MNQYLPDTYEQEFERYGNRSIASFLRMVGAEIPTNSDLIKWAEQGRLHTKYAAVTAVGATGGSANATLVSHSHTGTTDNDSPDHTHSITDKEHDHSFTLTQGGANNGSLPGGGNTTRGTVVTGKAFTGITGTLKQDNNHQHTFGTSVEGLTPTTNTANLPPYYALAFIMRVS